MNQWFAGEPSEHLNMNLCSHCRTLFPTPDDLLKHTNREYSCNNYCTNCKRSFHNSYKFKEHIEEEQCTPRPMWNQYLQRRPIVNNDVLSCLPKDLQLYVHQIVWASNIYTVICELFEHLSWYDNGDDLQCYIVDRGGRLLLYDSLIYQAPWIYTTIMENHPNIRHWDTSCAVTAECTGHDNEPIPRPQWCMNHRLDDLGPRVRLNFDRLKDHGITWTNWEERYFGGEKRL